MGTALGGSYQDSWQDSSSNLWSAYTYDCYHVMKGWLIRDAVTSRERKRGMPAVSGVMQMQFDDANENVENRNPWKDTLLASRGAGPNSLVRDDVWWCVVGISGARFVRMSTCALKYIIAAPAGRGVRVFALALAFDVVCDIVKKDHITYHVSFF